KKYTKLFEPFIINRLLIKNKFFMAPMLTPVGTTPEGTFTKESVEYFVRRAKGGVGLIITGANLADNEVEKHVSGLAPSPLTDPHAYVKVAAEMTERIHAFGTKILLQLTVGLGRSAIPGMMKSENDLVAPSTITNRWDARIVCRELRTDEVETLVKNITTSAKIAKDAGFDGVEIHAVHEGYLLDCFAMALFNQRTDKYGGDLRGRLTFAIEIVQSIKAVCGKDFPVVLRFSIKSFIKAIRQGGLPGESFKELGRDIPEALEAAKILQEAGYDAFDADAGTYDSWYWAHPPMYFKKGMYLNLAEELKKVSKVPVMVAGRMDDPDMALDALTNAKLDAVGLGRPLLVDPDYCNKLKCGMTEDIRHCIGCHDGCFVRLLEGKLGSCTVNPECGRELTVGISKACKTKKVVVIGGGVGGMEAARVSALRGYEVVVYDANPKLGGSLLIGGIPDFKEDDRALVAWYVTQLQKLKVTVKLGIMATKEMILKAKPDIVYVATGSNAIKLDLPGIESDNVAYAGDVLVGTKKVGARAVIIGGGLVGCETALHLATKGIQVTIAEELSDILKSGSALAPMNEWMLRDLLSFNKVGIYTNSKLVRVTQDGAVVTVNGKEKTLACDTVVIAVGYRGDKTLFEELAAEPIEVYNLGDSLKVRNIRGAIWDAYEVARSI
ncbi:MAG TPA: FAD-dependent oxidoreductase, partial [Clostridia bacterium]|nr:FAD-dependent oxidoreductase [Clostridia bacterium]